MGPSFDGPTATGPAYLSENLRPNPIGAHTEDIADIRGPRPFLSGRKCGLICWCVTDISKMRNLEYLCKINSYTKLSEMVFLLLSKASQIFLVFSILF